MLTAKEIVKALPNLTVSELKAIEEIALNLRYKVMGDVKDNLEQAMNEEK